MNLGQGLAEAARRWPDAPACTWEGRTWSFRELDRATDAVAHALLALGADRGHRVAVSMHNRPELLQTMYACFKLGACVVPMNRKLVRDEAAVLLEDSGASVVVTDGDGADVIAAAAPEGTSVVVVGEGAVPSGARPLASLVAAAPPEPVRPVAVDAAHLAWLFYTSGTTGRPKGAMLSHGNLAFMLAAWLADVAPMACGESTLHVAPLSHGAGFHALAAVVRGVHQVIEGPGSFRPERVLASLRDHRISSTWMVPTQIVLLVDALDGAPADLPDLRTIVYGGAPFLPAEIARAVEAFGPVLVQIYGQGESPMTITALSAQDHAAAVAGDRPERLASAGVARTGMEVRVVDDAGAPVPDGEVGEVVVRGLAVMGGYWQRPEATAEAVVDGWLRTGDLGRFDEAGYLYLLDRSKDLIISGGANVYAVEVEAALIDHPLVADVAVIGLPDRTWGELVVAVVVAAPDGPAPDEDELLRHAAASLASYKRPRRVVFVAALPRNAYGKVLKRELRDQVGQGA